ncbi:MAG: DUF108 domain-containing protein, partial [Candidatus Omnitrophota bacterium]
SMRKTDNKKIGIVGCGAIGEGVARYIDKKLQGKAYLWAIADRVKEKAGALAKQLSRTPKILDTDNLIKEVDLIIEAASQKCAEHILKKIGNRTKEVIILSVGALVKNPRFIQDASRAKIYVPSGAICGVDGIGALALGSIRRISLITSKPPRGLLGAEYIRRKAIRLEGIKKEKVVFVGSVKEAIRYFPRNINVAATLLLASSSKNVRVRIVANPHIGRNVHRIEIEAKEARVSIDIENVPSNINPKTSTLAILSVQYLLKKIFSSFKIGS